MMRLPTLAALTAWTMLPQAFFPAGAAAAESLSLTNLLDENLAPREIVYRTVAGRDLKLYVFDPPGLKEGDRRPAVMCIHGGSWMSGSPALFFPHSRYFAARGAVAISVEYRLTHQGANVAGTIFDCLSDCRAALRFMQTNAVALKLDPARIAVAGDSAGGHLAACLGIPVATEDSTPGAAKDTPPAALLLYNPELDLTTLRWAQSSSGVAIYGAGAAGSLPIAEIEKRFGKTPPERARALSPIFAIAKGQPPVLLMQGDKDTCVPVEQIRRFDQAYREAGNRCDYVELAGVAHAFVLPRYTAPDALVVKAIRRSDEFLAAIGWLAGPPTLQAAAEAAPVASSQPMAISRTQTNDPSPWKLHAPLPLARHDLQLVAWQGKLIAISGANDLTVSSVDSYDPATNAWSPRAPIPDRRGWFGAALLDGKIYCIGGKRIRAAPERRDSGDASPYEYRASLNIYDPTADCWSIGTPMRDPRAGCQAVALEGKLYVIGGDNPKLGFLDRVEIYDPAANTWQNGTALPDSREDLGAAAAGGKIYAIGGVKHSVRGDVFIFDPKTGRWTTGAPMPTPRRSFAIVAEGPRLWCLGGVPAGGGYTNVVEIYDTLANEWSTGMALPQAKAWMGAAVLGELLYMVGGANQNAASKQYVWLGDVHALPLRRTNEIAITWWGNMAVEVNLGEVNLVFDPYIKPAEPRFQYIFVSHPHYDHCHEPTLRQLLPPGSPIEMLFAARGCSYASRVDGPNNWSDTPLSDLGFVPPGKTLTLYPKYNDTVNSHIKKGELFEGPTEFTTGRIRVEAFRSHEDPAPQKTSNGDTGALTGSFPNLGFLVTDLKTGRSFAHTGDLWNAYPEMAKMRGKVDVLFYPLGKLGIAEKKKMMDYIRPRIAIPTHYRLLEPGFPIPPLYLTDMPNMSDAEICKNEETIRKASLGNWYLSPANPYAEIATQREAFTGLTRVVELKAGTRYVLPANLDEFQGSSSNMAPRSADAESKDSKRADH